MTKILNDVIMQQLFVISFAQTITSCSVNSNRILLILLRARAAHLASFCIWCVFECAHFAKDTSCQIRNINFLISFVQFLQFKHTVVATGVHLFTFLQNSRDINFEE